MTDLGIALDNLKEAILEAVRQKPMRREDAAEYMGIGLRSLDRLITTKTLPHVKISGVTLILRKDIDKMLEDRKIKRKEIEL